MPEIARFYGIVIKMFYDDHAPPHFHAEYAEHEAQIAVVGSRVFAGDLPARAAGMVREWAALHEAELMACWDRARNNEPPGKIAPLE